MPLEKLFPASIWIWRRLTGRIARRLYLSIVLLLVLATITARFHSFVLAQRIYAVLSSLERLRIDQTTEAELREIVPYLNRSNYDVPVGPSVEHYYYVVISNESSWMKFVKLMHPTQREWSPQKWLFNAADWIGYRYLSFGASVIVLNGKVSSLRYGIADELVFPRQIGNIVSVKSVHGFWTSRGWQTAVSSVNDESPQFRLREFRSKDFGFNRISIEATYTFDASPDIVARAFKVQLSCFWGLRGCREARQIVPLLWENKNSIEAATLSRLSSNDPCSDRIVAGRVKYLPDIDILLLQSGGFRHEQVNEEGLDLDEIRTDYKLVEVLRGQSRKSWESVRSSKRIPYPGDYTREMPNNGLAWTNPGDRILLFASGGFESCRVVAATPSVLSIVRNTTPATKRVEDEPVGPLQ